MPTKTENNFFREAAAGPEHPVVLALARSNSHSQTYAAIAQALKDVFSAASFSVADLGDFELASQVNISYPGPGQLRKFTLRDFGLRLFVPRERVNLLLNGGPWADRRVCHHARKLLRDLKPAALVMCKDAYFIEFAFIREARKLGIPTILIQEGPFNSLGTSPPQSFKGRFRRKSRAVVQKLGLVPTLPLPGFAGHRFVAVASEYYRQRWQQGGADLGTLAVVGIPRYDPLAGARESVLRRSLAETPPARPAEIIFVVQPFARFGVVKKEFAAVAMTEAALGLRAVLDAVPANLTVRLHPKSVREDIEAFDRVLGGRFAISPPNQPFVEVIAAFHLCVGFYSSAVLESLCCNVPAICVELPREAFFNKGEADKMAWLKNCGIPCVPGQEGVATAALRALAKGVQIPQDKIEQQTGAIDGKSARRTARLLCTAMNHSSTSAA